MVSPPLDRLVDTFWESVPPSWHCTRSVIRRIANEKFQMSTVQFQTLRRIRKGFNSVSALAEEGHISRPAVSRIVDTLVQKGWVTRQINPADRRQQHLQLTPDGERVLWAIYADAELWLQERFRQLSTEEQQSLLYGMELLKKAFLESL